MEYFLIKEGTHVVLKEADITEHLTKTEADILGLLYEKIIKGRASLGKKENKYYVVNTDEPYADDILEIIRENESNTFDPNSPTLFDIKENE